MLILISVRVLNVHLFRHDLIIWFTARVFRERLACLS